MPSSSLLALNAGSSSIKFTVFDANTLAPALEGQIEGIGPSVTANLIAKRTDGAPLGGLPDAVDAVNTHSEALDLLLEHVIAPHAGHCHAVGHRVVHGGTQFAEPMLVDDAVLDMLRSFIPMARSHQPHNVAGIDAARAAMPGTPQIACFDTAVHRSVPEHRQLFAIPKAWGDKGIRRYGFHGLSYEAIAAQLPEVLGETAQGRIVICHLGNGSSVCGMESGVSRATSMGFTPLDGLMMGNRPGHLDPGVVLYLLREEGIPPETISEMLHQKSGLLGISGLSSDMRTLEASDDPNAKLAVTMFVDRLVQEIGLIAAALGGIDALVFTAGIGENSRTIRAMALQQIDWLGFTLDADANAANGPVITTPDSARPALVIRTDEEGVIARHAARLIGLASAASSVARAVSSTSSMRAQAS